MSKHLSAEETQQYYLANPSARRFVLWAVCTGSIMSPLALASVNLAMPVIALELNANAVLVSWMPTGFLLSTMIFMLPMGRMADQHGRKRFYFIGVLLTGVFSFLAGFVQSMEWLLAMRVLQGLSMSMVFGAGIAIITSIYPESERGSAIGIFGAAIYLALTLSPLIGGWLTEYFGWRSVFWIQAIPALIVTAMMGFVKGEWKSTEKKPFDWTGSLIFAFWSGTLAYGLSGLPRIDSVITLIMSFAYLWLFFYHQKRVKHPLVDLKMFIENRLFSFSLLTCAFIYAANYPLGFLLSLFFQLAFGYSPIDAGNILLMQALMMAVISPFAGKLSDRFDAGRMATLGCALMASGFLLMSFISAESANARVIIVALFWLGVGFGLFSTPNMNAAMNTVKKSDIGVAAASLSLARTIGNMLGVSLMGLLIYNLIGAREFTTGETKELTSALHLWLYLAFAFCVIATLFSHYRGQVKKAPMPEDEAAAVCKEPAV